MFLLELPLHETLYRPTKLGKDDPGNNHLGLEFTGISSQNVGRWRERLSLDDAAVIEYWLREELIHWGYSPSCDQKVALQAFANSIIGIIANISTTTHSNMINNMRDKAIQGDNLLKIL